MKRIIDRDPERVQRFVCDLIGRGYIPGSCVGIGLEEDGELIAGVIYENYNGANIIGHVAAVHGKKWMNREFLWYCFHYVFAELGCKRLTGIVADDNLTALNFDKHLGFKEEFRLREAHPNGDLVILVMRPEDCRFLGMKDANHKRRKEVPCAA